MAIFVNAQEAQEWLPELLMSVDAGESVVITRNGEPVAQLLPHEPAAMVFGGFEVHLEDAFFAPLPETELAAWESGGPLELTQR